MKTERWECGDWEESSRDKRLNLHDLLLFRLTLGFLLNIVNKELTIVAERTFFPFRKKTIVLILCLPVWFCLLIKRFRAF